MNLAKRVLILMSALAALTVALPGVAAADDGAERGNLLRSGLVGSTPPPAGPSLFGVAPGGAPWVADDGSRVRVGRDGHMVVRVRGLVIPTAPANGTNPVPQLSASLVCNGVIAATTAAVPFSTAGDARISTTVDVPTPCLAPAVLIHPNTVTTVYIAATG